MKYPKLRVPQAIREMVDVFGGYNHNLRIGEGEFFDMGNITSDQYPVLSPRPGRDVYMNARELNGIGVNNGLCYVVGCNFMTPDGQEVIGILENSKKRLINMGAHVIILPDKKWVNVAKALEIQENNRPSNELYGCVEAEFTGDTNEKTVFAICKADGTIYTDIGGEEPEAPKDGALWMDTSGQTPALKQWAENMGMWVSIATTYIKIERKNIGKDFKVGDGIRYTIDKGNVPPKLSLPLCTLGASGSAVIQARGTDFIVVPGVINGVVEHECTMIVRRRMPDMDFVIECNNRLWGCKCGMVTSENGDLAFVNEIYCSKLGDYTNWDVFTGIATDSYVVSVGATGPFTGAISYLGNPIFFKENCMIRISGDYPANFHITTTPCVGVQQNCGDSLVIVNNVVYYKGQSGVYAFDGSLPVCISSPLGDKCYDQAVAGGVGGKYYISMKETAGDKWHLFVYDTFRRLWHREDDLQVESFCLHEGALLAAVNGTILSLTGSTSMETVEWFVETGPIGITTVDMKTVSRLTLRLSMAAEAELRILVKYDFDEDWDELCCLQSTSLRSFSLPVTPKRCDNMRLRLEGIGDCKLYGITKTILQGRELS